MALAPPECNVMPESSGDRNPLDLLAEDFVARFRAGERPALSEYAGRHPDLAAEIRDLFPALVEMEQLKPSTADQTGSFPSASEPTDPIRVGEFRILRRIGSGGMGVVYEAVQESLGRNVALKLLPTEALVDPKRLERFRREARAAARLHHTNIVPVFGVGEADGRHFYAMQFIAGHPLDAVIKEVKRLKEKSQLLPADARGASEVAAALMTDSFAEQAPISDEGPSPVASIQTMPRPIVGDAPSLPSEPSSANATLTGSISDSGRHYWSTIARIGAQAAEALAYAHAQGILHRDIKPSNLLLDLHGAVWVTDFGLAKAMDADDLTHTGDIIGTLRYLAPERFEGKGDHRADVYALGLTLYELLTLQPAFQSANRAKLIEQVVTASPQRPRSINREVPRDLETIVIKATTRDPVDRYQTAAELAEDLRRFLEDRPIKARRATSSEQAIRWCRRNPTVASLLAAVLIVFAAGAGAASLYAVRASELAASAEDERGKAVEREQEADRERVRANGERANAVAREQEANVERLRARAAEAESRRQLVRQNIMTGAQHLSLGDPAAALLWYRRAWESDQDSENEKSHRTRVASMLAQQPPLLGACFHSKRICDAVFSPDGKRVLARDDDNEAFVWDYVNSKLLIPPLRHSGRIRHICFSRNGALIATASVDGTACVWSAANGQKLHTMKHDGPLTWVEFDPEEVKLLTSAEDKTVRLWDLKTGKQLDWKFPTDEIVEHATFSPQGNRLLVTTRAGMARVWSIDPVEPLSPELPQQVSSPTQRDVYNYHPWPQFSPDGGLAAIFKDSSIRTWSKGDEFKEITVKGFILETHFVGQSRRFLATGAMARLPVVNRQDNKVEFELAHPRNANIGSASADGRYLITASAGGPVHLWDAATGKPLWSPQRCADFASAVSFSRDSSKCLAASQDGTIRVWACTRQADYPPYQYDDGRANVVYTFYPDGHHQHYSADGRSRLTILGPQPPMLYPAGAGPVPLECPAGLTSAKFCNDGSRIILSGPNAVAVADARTGKLLHPPVPFDNPPKFRLGRLSRDGRRLAVWDGPKTLSVFDLDTAKRVFGPTSNEKPGKLIFGPDSNLGNVTSLILSQDGRRLAAFTPSTGTLTIYDVDSGKMLSHGKWFRGPGAAFEFSDDGKRVLVACGDGAARVFETETGQPIGPVIRIDLGGRLDGKSGGTVNHCNLSPDGGLVVAFDKSLPGVRMWDSAGGDLLMSVPTPGINNPNFLGFSADGSRFKLIDVRDVNEQKHRPTLSVPVPRFDVPNDLVGPLIRLLTGQRIDETDGLDVVDQMEFRNNLKIYRRAYLSWKGLPLNEP
jgi:eukaryotic-like serine/threonine-protein kinase